MTSGGRCASGPWAVTDAALGPAFCAPELRPKPMLAAKKSSPLSSILPFCAADKQVSVKEARGPVMKAPAAWPHAGPGGLKHRPPEGRLIAALGSQ
jgi:hypothetical protein